uniref:Uncharacterized protein n=1 Tax=Setaria digitata TaxID=48799 RepID=A0A915PBP0_9BILA
MIDTVIEENAETGLTARVLPVTEIGKVKKQRYGERRFRRVCLECSTSSYSRDLCCRREAR